MSERAQRLRAAEAVCEAAELFLADWFIASVLGVDETVTADHMWERKDVSERALNDAVERWRATRGRGGEHQ
jgi:hypothetical protein